MKADVGKKEKKKVETVGTDMATMRERRRQGPEEEKNKLRGNKGGKLKGVGGEE